MVKIKLAVFDLEGTVFKKSYKLLSGSHHDSAWGALCHHLCEEARKEDEINRERYYSKEKMGIKYPYSEWVLDTLRIYKKYGLTQGQFQEVIDSVEYFEGVERTFKTLQENNIKIAAVSSGLKALADRVIIDHGLEHTFAAAELRWCDKGNLRNWNIMPTDFQQKRSIVEMLLADMHIEPKILRFAKNGSYSEGEGLLSLFSLQSRCSRDGRIFGGSNVENAAYGDTVCAERSAVCNAVANGCRPGDFEAIAIASSGENFSPCGSCRQVLQEFGSSITVIFEFAGEINTMPLSDLFPKGFPKKRLTAI